MPVKIGRFSLGGGFLFWAVVLILIGMFSWFYPVPNGFGTKTFWQEKSRVNTSANVVIQGRMKPVTLVLPDNNGEWLIRISSEIESAESVELDIERILTELFEESAKTNELFPADIAIRGVFVYDDVAVVSLSEEVREQCNPGVWTEMLALYSVVNTVVENFDNITSLRIIIDDKQSPVFIHHVAIDKPLNAAYWLDKNQVGLKIKPANE
ncbi:MAG TPA: GerMN domain-containing protein [Nitrospinota bacterium]|jgi:hypothetical protein|nr:GerMN domain-containing protein [Nitrospinota bacterium]|tara:strand:- start:246608 stop:247237 length:630 start_codon:yes stop_codon:yes gene_type:complete